MVVLVVQRLEAVRRGHLAQLLRQAREVQDVSVGHDELGPHGAHQHVAAAHGDQVEARQAAQPPLSDGAPHDGAGGPNARGDDELVAAAALGVLLVGALRPRGAGPAAARAAHEQPGRHREHVREAAEHDGHAVGAEVEDADGLAREALLVQAGHNQVGGGANERAPASAGWGKGCVRTESARARARTRAREHTHAHAHAYAHMGTHTNTHAHTHTLTFRPGCWHSSAG